jgi:hypothetical protein
MRGMPRPRRKWNRIPTEEIERCLFSDGVPLEHWFVYGEAMYGCWFNGETLLEMNDDDDLAEACIHYLTARGAPQYPQGATIPKTPPDPGREDGGN